MEDEDGTCLLDVLCDPQALNDFLHGTNELQTEDLLISSSSGEHSLFTDAPSPVSLLGVDRNSPDTPPPGCVDLSFLEEALLSSPEGGDDLQVEPAGPVETGCKGEGGGTAEEEKGEEEKGEEGVTCDILQQSLQEADITEQTMALEAGLAQPGETLSLYSPAPLLPTAAVPFLPKPVTLPVAPALPRDTQAAVEPPQPSLLAIGPGCPSLKPAAPPQLMGLLPGSVFPAAPPETSFSLSPAQGSSMIIHKAVPSLTGRSLITPTLRTTAAPPSILLQRAPLPIQPKLPISIQPRLVQISPKPSGQKPSPGLTFIPGTPSQNILLSQPAGPKPAPPQPQATQQLPKPVSLQLVNQGGSFMLQPQGLFQGQNQFLLPGQCPVTISQPISAARSLFPPGHQGSSIHSVTPSAGQLVDGPQILTVPHRQLNFSPVFTTPTGQLALRQATVVSGPLQLQSAPPTVFQVPAQIAGTYTPGGQGQRATLVHSPALGNHHITLINSSGVLPPDLTSISILNGPQVVQGLPFPPQTQGAQAGVTEGGLSLQQASVVLLPERTVPEERPSSEETFHQLPQSYGPVLQNVSVQPTTRGLPSPSPSMVPVLRTPPEPPLVQDPAPDPAPDLPKLLVPSAADLAQRAQEADPALAADQGFMQLQQQALRSPLHPSDLLVETLPVASLESLRSPPADETELQVRVQVQVGSSVGPDDALAAIVDRSAEASPLPSSPEATPLRSPSSPVQDAASFSPTGEPGTPAGSQPPTQRQVHHQLQVQVQVLQALRAPEDQEVQMPAPQNQDQARHLVQVQAPSSVYSSPSPLVGSVSGPLAESTSLSPGGEDLPIAQDEEHEPAAPSVMEGEVFPLVLPPSSSLTPQDILPPPPPLALVLGPSMAPPHQQPGTKPPSFHPSPLSPDMWSSRQPVRGEEEQRMEQRIEEKLTPAVRRHRFQTRLVQDQDWVQDPCTQSGFWSLEDAARRLLPYHTCSGATPTQDHFHSVDEEFDSVSRFLLKRTKDMVNKYRQLLLAETQQEIPSAEMVMLERLFLQAERFTLGEERRKARRDPESFLAALSTSASSPHAACSSGPAHPSSSGPAHPGSSSSAHPSASPSPPPAWTRLSDRPPGLRTYRSSSRGGALRLTIKHESGSRKVVRHSSGDPGRRRDHAGRLTNGGGSAGPPAGGPAQHGEEASNGGRDRTPEAQTVPDPQIIKPHGPVSPPEPLSDRLAPSPGGAPAAPQAKRCRAETPPPPPPPPWSKRRGSPPPPPPRQDDAVLSQHLQSAIDSILELQRLQGPPAAPGRAPAGPPLDHAVTGLVGGKPVR